MKTKLIASLVTGISLTLGTLITKPIQARPSSHNFSCRNVNGTPTTLAQRQGKSVTMIRWSKNDGYFGGVWTPEKRCQEVSAKFQKYAQEGNLRYITHGIKNGYPIICIAKTKGGHCSGQLFTLRKGDNPNDKVRRLLDRNSVANNPLAESEPTYIVNVNEKIYLDLNIYLDSAESIEPNNQSATNQSNQRESTSPINSNSETNEEGSAWFSE